MACIGSPGVAASPPSQFGQHNRLEQQQLIVFAPRSRSQHCRLPGAIPCPDYSVRPLHSSGTTSRHVGSGRYEWSRSWDPVVAAGPCRRHSERRVSSALRGIETEWRTSMSYEQVVTLQVGTLPSSNLRALGTCHDTFLGANE